MKIIKYSNLLIAFLLEIVSIIIISYWGFLQGKTSVSKYTLAILLPLVAIILWGRFAAPASKHRIKFPYRIIFELVFFAIGTFLLYKTGNDNGAMYFGITALLSKAVAFIYHQ